jgi:hypothetical protein
MTIWLRRSNGRYAICVEQDTDQYRRIRVVRRFPDSTWTALEPPPRGWTLEEAIHIARQEIPEHEVPPGGWRVEPYRRESDGAIVVGP